MNQDLSEYQEVSKNNVQSSSGLPYKKTITALIAGFAIGFACALPAGYSAGYKSAAKMYSAKAENGELITAAVKAEPADSGDTVLSEYQRKNMYFKAPLTTGGEISLEDYKGKPVLLMFYTETCPYCRKAAPEIEKLYKKYSEKGLAVIGMCGQSDKNAAIRFSKDLGTTFPMAYDVYDAMRKYGVQGVPFIYLLNKNHELEDVWPGFDYPYVPKMEEAIKKAIL